MENKRIRILTGDRTTGKLHLGHWVGSLQNRLQLHLETFDGGDFYTTGPNGETAGSLTRLKYETFIILADVQALTTHWERSEMIRESVLFAVLDQLAIGIDPEIATFFIQSYIPEIAELTEYFSLMTNFNQIRHNPTVKTEAKNLGIRWFGEEASQASISRGDNELTVGFLTYPISQAADITFCKGELVPVGEDQVPHIELTRDIVAKFNQLFGKGKEILPLPKALVGQVGRLMGLDGNAKMSKSLGNVIYLSDEETAIWERVRNGVTDPEKIKKDDPGHPEICNIFSYHKTFNEPAAEVIKTECEKGARGCVGCKKELCTAINTLISPFRERRRELESNESAVWDVLYDGTQRARKVAKEVMAEVRDAMGIGYLPKLEK